MKQLIITISILFIIESFAYGQNQINLPEVDRETYSLWQKADWRGIIKIGKQALKADVDFYYLRVRMGIAYFETRNYHAAIHHFEKAYKVNNQESYLKEYLYYSYLYAGKFMEAQNLFTTFNASLKKKIGIKEDKFIDAINIQYGVRRITDENAVETYPSDYIAPNDGLQEITKNLNILGFGLRHDFTPKFSLSHAFTNIKKESFEHRIVNGSIKTTNDLKTTINQYYLSGNSRIAKNLNLLFGFHIVNVRYPVEVSFFRQGNVFFATETAKETDLVGFLSFYKDLRYITLNASVSFAGLNSANQAQGNIGLTFYPLGNLNLYSTSIVSYQRETYPNGTKNDEIILSQLVGFKALKFLWFEGFLNKGNLTNFISDNGASVFNGTETIKQRMGARAIVLINQNLNFQINYTYSLVDSYFIESSNPGAKYNPIEYSNQLISGGLIWNF